MIAEGQKQLDVHDTLVRASEHRSWFVDLTKSNDTTESVWVAGPPCLRAP